MTKSLPPKNLVLYVDDDTDDVSMLHEALQEYSHAIDLVSFEDGFSLLEYLQKLQPFQPAPCLIILDINLPRMSGKEILKTLRSDKKTADVPVVLFSTSTLPADAAMASSLQAGFVTKPLVAGQIHQIVDQLLAFCSDEVKKKLYKR